VNDARAPTVWVWADAHGNKACVTTWLGRDPDHDSSEGDAAGKIEDSESSEGSSSDRGTDSDSSSQPSAGSQTTGQSERGSDESAGGDQQGAPTTAPSSTAP
jgi:hypothetical protein